MNQLLHRGHKPFAQRMPLEDSFGGGGFEPRSGFSPDNCLAGVKLLYLKGLHKIERVLTPSYRRPGKRARPPLVPSVNVRESTLLPERPDGYSKEPIAKSNCTLAVIQDDSRHEFIPRCFPELSRAAEVRCRQCRRCLELDAGQMKGYGPTK